MKFFYLLCCIFALSFCTMAQIPEPPKNIPSPNAYTFVQNTNVPVSHFSGLPQINIPLGVINYKEINLPINLSYSYSGFKPEQHPGWVGLGWGLEIGGVITRTIKGEFPDEFEFAVTPNLSEPNVKQPTYNGFLVSPYSSSSLKDRLLRSSPVFYNAKDYIRYPNNPDEFILVPHKLPYYANGNYRYAPERYYDRTSWLGVPSQNYPYLQYPASTWYSAGGKLDAFSDEYTFNFMGISGKFIFMPSGEIVAQCNQKIKVEVFSDKLKTPFNPVGSRLIGPTTESYLYNYSAFFEEGKYPKTFSGFVITTDNGYKYYFGKNAEMFDDPNIQNPTNEYFSSVGIEYSISANSYATDYWTADSWYLTRIVCNDGRKIDFEYERKDLALQEFKSTFATKPNAKVTSKIARLISPVYLKKISSDFLACEFFISKSNELRPSMQTYNPNFPEENVDFVYYINNPNNQINWYKLDSIRMSGDNIGMKKVKFQYNNLSTERLFLKAVAEYDNSNNQKTHELTYDNSKVLPNYMSSQTDHWGYWNGKSILDLNFGNLAAFTASKEADFEYTRPGSLVKIKYPTGGEVNFEFEQNSYSKYVPEIRTEPLVFSGNQLIGGLRIKKITHYDPVALKTLVKKYFYTSSYNPLYSESANAAGISSGISTRVNKYLWNGTGAEYDDVYGTHTSSSALTIISDQSIMSFTDGYHVNYSKVFEIDENNGFSSYIYSNYDNGHEDDNYISILNNVISPYTKFSSRAGERGLLLETAKFSQSNDMVSKTVITYKPDYLDNNELPYRILEDGQLLPQIESDSVYLRALASTFKFYTYRYLKDKEINYSFDRNITLETSTQYFYDNPSHGQISRIEVGNSQGDISKTYYRYALDMYDVNNPNYLLSVFRSRNYIANILQKVETKVKFGTNIEQVTGAELYEYNLRPNYPDVLLKRAYKLDVKTLFPLSSFTHFLVDKFSWGEQWTKDVRYREIMDITAYDQYKNIMGYRSNKDATINFIGYDAKGLKANIIAKGTNEVNPKYAFESFENFTSTTSRTGFGSLLGTYTLKGAFNGLMYIFLDMWVNGTNIPIVSYNSNMTATSYSMVMQQGDWRLYRYVLSSAPLNNITINSNGSYVDDVRALPLGAIGSFNTYTYSNGLLAASSNEREQITFYDYDSFNRLKTEKDQYGNIVKNYRYNFSGQSVLVYANSVHSQSFIKNNCSPGETGGAVIYTVAAGTYSSTVSQAAADALATADITANGQAYANSNGTCTQVSTCKRYRISMPSSESNNLYIRYKPCGSSSYVTSSLMQLEQEPSMEGEIAIMLCTDTPMYDIWFMYGEYGPSQMIYGLTITEIGSCQ